jgi:hypothetical protein
MITLTYQAAGYTNGFWIPFEEFRPKSRREQRTRSSVAHNPVCPEDTDNRAFFQRYCRS